MEQPIITIIIPVYKVEAYLDRCVQSVVDQTYKNLEIILVDDGSPDNCPAMCDAWKERDSRIRVIHQENKGVSAARNAGIEIAGGDYLAFVDSDDIISPLMYETLLNVILAQNAQIACCCALEISATDVENYEFTIDSRFFQDPQFCFSLTQAESLKWIFTNNQNINQIVSKGIWNKLYHKSVFSDDSVRFSEGIHIAEDLEFLASALLHAYKIAIISEPVMYLYVQYKTSSGHDFNTKHFGAIDAKIKRIELLSKHAPNYVLSAQLDLCWHWFYLLWWADHAAHGQYEPERKKLAKDIKSYIKENHLWRHLSKVQKGKYLLLHFGLPVYDFVWNKYHQK